MKVAIVGPYPFPGRQISGGVERVIDTLLQHIVGEVELTLIVPNAPENWRAEVHGVPVVYLERSAGPGVLTYWSADAKKLSMALKELAPDIVHFQGVSGIARGVQCPGVVTVHGIAHHDLVAAYAGSSLLERVLSRAAAELQKRVERYYRKRIGNVIVINEYVVAALPDIATLQQFPIVNPLDKSFVETPLVGTLRPKRIISAGRIGPRKKTAQAVAIAARVLENDHKASAIFFGAPDRSEDLEICRRIAARYGVEKRLTFPGNVTAARLRQELDRSSIFLMTSAQETAPVAIAEANARGVAVLAPDAFGIHHMITPGVNGFFLTGNSDEEKAMQLQHALGHTWNRIDISERARQEYSPYVVARQTIEAYHKILDGH